VPLKSQQPGETAFGPGSQLSGVLDRGCKNYGKMRFLENPVDGIARPFPEDEDNTRRM
jgi:hypothetical protein